MEETLRSKGNKWTNIILLGITLSIIAYVVYAKGMGAIGSNRLVELEESGQILSLDAQVSSTIGLNGKQVYQITSNGIAAYSFEGEEVWSDTFSMPNMITSQRGSYIAVTSRQGSSLILFNDKGRQAEITTTYPIVYFSINEQGGVVTIENKSNTYIVTAYDENGKWLCSRQSTISTDGYPTTAELSPTNKLLLISYLSVDEPQIVSRVVAIDLSDGKSENIDNIKYGYKQPNNLIYDIEFISQDTWVSIGDKAIDWYQSDGTQIATRTDLSLVFTPYLFELAKYGAGYLPVVVTEKPTQNIVHRQDKVLYLDNEGAESFSVSLEAGVSSIYADAQGVVVQCDNQFVGYNKLGNPFFNYTATTDVSQVIYNSSLKKGIAVNKDKVLLLTPKRETN